MVYRVCMEQCWKCQGSGQYRNFGVCFLCKGTGQIKSRMGFSVEPGNRKVVTVTCLDTGEHSFEKFGQYQRCKCGIIR